MNKLHKRILDISYRNKLSHIGSNLTTVDTLYQIHQIKKDNEPFVLSNGHAGLALYAVLEDKYGVDAEELWHRMGVHPTRDEKYQIWASSGSLGHGLGIALGMALADRNRLVYVTISDGECSEGSIWEALAIARKYEVENLRVALIANGYSAYDTVDVDDLDMRINMFYPTMTIKSNMFAYPDFLQGLQGHYKVLSKDEYETCIR